MAVACEPEVTAAPSRVQSCATGGTERLGGARGEIGAVRVDLGA